MTAPRLLLTTVGGQTYNLDHLVRFVQHNGTREVGATEHVRSEAEPVFETFVYLELCFSDGSRVTLDGVQSQAMLRFLNRQAQHLDLDQVDAAALGPVLVHDTEAGDVILPVPGSDAFVKPAGAGPDGVEARPEVGDFPVRLTTDPADLLLTRRSDGNPADSGSHHA